MFFPFVVFISAACIGFARRNRSEARLRDHCGNMLSPHLKGERARKSGGRNSKGPRAAGKPSARSGCTGLYKRTVRKVHSERY